MKAFPNFSLKPIINEIIEAINQFNAKPVRVEQVEYLSPIEVRRYLRRLRENRQYTIR